MDQQDNNKTKPKLASAEELRGKKSGSTTGKGKKKNLLLSVLSLVVLLAVAVGIYLYAEKQAPAGKEEPEPTAAPVSTTVKIVAHAAEDVDRVTVEQDGGDTYTVIALNDRTEEEIAQLIAENTPEGEEPVDPSTLGGAMLAGDPAFELDQSAVKAQLEYCANMTATALVESGVKDLSTFGLDKPALRVTMEYRDGSTQVLCFGSQVPTSSSRYLTPEGSGEVYTMYSRPYTSFLKTRNQLHVVSMPMPFSSSADVKDFTITRRGEDPIRVRYLNEDENTISISSLVMVEPFWYNVNSDRVTEVMDGIAALTVTSYAGELSELPDCGLEDPRYTVYASNGEDGELTFKVGGFAGTDQVYVMKDDTESVYLADSSVVAFLDKVNPPYLVDQFANLVYINYVDSVEVEGDGIHHEFSIHREPILDASGVATTDSRGNIKTDDTYFVDGEPFDESKFKKIYQEIIGTLVSKVNDDYTYEGEVVATVTYHLNKEPGEFQVQYMAFDGDYYAVHRDGVSLFLIKQAKVHDMIANIESLLTE